MKKVLNILKLLFSDQKREIKPLIIKKEEVSLKKEETPSISQKHEVSVPHAEDFYMKFIHGKNGPFLVVSHIDPEVSSIEIPFNLGWQEKNLKDKGLLAKEIYEITSNLFSGRKDLLMLVPSEEQIKNMLPPETSLAAWLWVYFTKLFTTISIPSPSLFSPEEEPTWKKLKKKYGSMRPN